MSNFSEQVTESNRLIHNIASVGVVSELDPVNGKMRLMIGDNETDWVDIPSIACGDLKIWRCPTKDEQFAVICPSGNLGNAIAVAALPSEQFPNPSDDPDMIVVKMPSGSFVINQNTGDATVTLNQLTFDVPNVDFKGKVHAQDEISSDKDVKADRISLRYHKTSGVRSGNEVSGVPQ